MGRTCVCHIKDVCDMLECFPDVCEIQTRAKKGGK